jgi:hypothetical protein
VAKTSVATLAAENAALTARVAVLEDWLRRTVVEVRAMKAAPPATRPLPAKTETVRVPRAEFDRALEDLRAEAVEAGSTQRIFSRDAILERATSLRTLEANTRAAGDSASEEALF